MRANTDPITMEVVKNALSSIADEMALVIMRTAYSSIVRDSMDYSTGLCDREGRAIAHGLTMALHLGSFPDAMKHLIADYGERREVIRFANPGRTDSRSPHTHQLLFPDLANSRWTPFPRCK